MQVCKWHRACATVVSSFPWRLWGGGKTGVPQSGNDDATLHAPPSACWVSKEMIWPRVPLAPALCLPLCRSCPVIGRDRHVLQAQFMERKSLGLPSALLVIEIIVESGPENWGGRQMQSWCRGEGDLSTEKTPRLVHCLIRVRNELYSKLPAGNQLVTLRGQLTELLIKRSSVNDMAFRRHIDFSPLDIVTMKTMYKFWGG